MGLQVVTSIYDLFWRSSWNAGELGERSIRTVDEVEEIGYAFTKEAAENILFLRLSCKLGNADDHPKKASLPAFIIIDSGECECRPLYSRPEFEVVISYGSRINIHVGLIKLTDCR
eukprot:scaffold308977_cov69-Attheya_sp.AAC.1